MKLWVRMSGDFETEYASGPDTEEVRNAIQNINTESRFEIIPKPDAKTLAFSKQNGFYTNHKTKDSLINWLTEWLG